MTWRVSLKAVLPALTGRGYQDLQIQNGTTASFEFLRIAFTNLSAVTWRSTAGWTRTEGEEIPIPPECAW
jgi:hypothetical protein